MKRVIITGGSEGLGLEISKLFLEKGYEVICLSRHVPNIEAIHIKTDLGNKQSIQNAINIIKENFGKFEYLINCVGILNIEKLGDLKYKNIDELIKINTIAPMILISGLLTSIKNNVSDIVNVGSTVAFKSYEAQCAYGASKWAMRGIINNLQLELKNTKCRVIGFHPGGFKSKLFEKATGVKVDLSTFMNPKELARFMLQILELPKNMEVSEVIINRKR